MDDLEVITTESTIEGSAILIDIMNSCGITSVFDAGAFDASESQLDILQQLENTFSTVNVVKTIMDGKVVYQNEEIGH